MQLWSKCLVCALMMVFVAGTVTQTVHASAMSAATANSSAAALISSSAAARNLKMSEFVADDADTVADDAGIGCPGCATTNDGSMTCATGCAAQFVGLLAAPPPMITQTINRVDYSPLVLGLWEWRSSPDPYPPRPLTQI